MLYSKGYSCLGVSSYLFFFFLRGKSGTIDKDTKGVPCMSKKQKFTWEDHTERFSRYFPMREDDLEKNT